MNTNKDEVLTRAVITIQAISSRTKVIFTLGGLDHRGGQCQSGSYCSNQTTKQSIILLILPFVATSKLMIPSSTTVQLISILLPKYFIANPANIKICAIHEFDIPYTNVWLTFDSQPLIKRSTQPCCWQQPSLLIKDVYPPNMGWIFEERLHIKKAYC